jgi:hypothetical protein
MEANGNPSYLNRLSEQLIDALTEHGALTLDELLIHGGGAFPTDVMSRLQAMCNSKSIVFDGSRYRRFGTVPAEDRCRREPKILPVSLPDAHPLDFDWRFTREGREYLLSLICKYTIPESRLGLFGAPTILQELERIRPHTYLFDRNPALRAVFSPLRLEKLFVNCDLRSPLKSEAKEFDFVLADPPWYPEYYEAFVDRANELLRVNGILFVSVLPWLTRPSASIDRTFLVQHCFARGFDIIAVMPGVLQYESPQFEKAALATAGINVSSWRRGDLFVFRNVGELDPEPEDSDLDDTSWHRYVLGAVQIRVIDGTGLGDFQFSVVAPSGPVLPSVSRRSILRRKVHIWTSGNLAYSTTRPEVVRFSLERLQAGQALSDVITSSKREFKLSSGEVGKLDTLMRQLLGGAQPAPE